MAEGLQPQYHERLTQVFRQVFDNPSLTIKDEHTASDIPGWDSVTHVSLIVSIEEAFDITFSTAEIASTQSVGDLVRLIAERTAVQNRAA